MDLSTVIGLVAGFGCILASILYGGSVLAFIDPPSIMVVMGGTTAVLFVGFPPDRMKNAVAAVDVFVTSATLAADGCDWWQKTR